MKHKKILTILIIIFLTINLIPSPGVCEKNEINTLFFNSHKPITINGDQDFTRRNGVKSGSGTQTDPYVISNWNIRPLAKNGIKIQNTNSYFKIENCSIYGNKISKPSGIFLKNVSNGKIINCYCSKTYFGIIITSSSNNIVENYISENCDYGLSINGCPTGDVSSASNNVVRNSLFTDCSNGTYFCCLPNSYNNLIESCMYIDNDIGILVDHLTHYVTLVGCNFSKNNIGLKIHKTSSNNYISNNVFWKNNLHAIDNCLNNWDNGLYYGGNFWRNHDYNYPYNITGVGKNVDNYPLSNPPENNPLIAFFKIDSEMFFVNEKIAFDASLSYDSDNIISYNWNLDDETIKNQKRINHSYSSAGNYIITLNVTNRSAYDIFEKEIEVIELSDNEIIVNEGDSIQDAISASSPGDKIIVESGIYYETIVIDKPFLNLIGNNYNDTIIDGKKKDVTVSIKSSYVNISNFTIMNSSSNQEGIKLGVNNYVIDTVHCSIKNNLIKRNGIGIGLYESQDNQICDNIFYDNYYGIYANSSYYNIFNNNNFTFNSIGLYLYWGSNWNQIIRNTFVDNQQIGIYLVWSHYNKILENNIYQNKIGIELDHSLSSKVNNNNIYKNIDKGIYYIENIGKKDFKNNWWGSCFGPSGLLNLFGDEFVGENEKGSRPRFSPIIRFLACYPWEIEEISFS